MNRILLPGLGSQDVTRERVPSHNFAASGYFEALGGAAMSLELQLYFSFYQNLNLQRVLPARQA